MNIGFYPGCSMQGSSPEYNESVQAICSALGITLSEVSDWNCCGATAAHNLNRELSLALPARILAHAAADGLEEVLVPCAACYNRLKMVQHEIGSDRKLQDSISEILDEPYHGNVRILSILDFLEREVEPLLAGKIISPLKQKVACYYGCLLVRPQDILHAIRHEDPQAMDRIMQRLGAEAIDWAYKTECCGAGLSVSRTDVVAELSGRILDDATRRGAKAIIVACPMCHSNLDMRRKAIEQHRKQDFDMPVMYITQAIGLALGLEPVKLGLQRHFVPVNLEH